VVLVTRNDRSNKLLACGAVRSVGTLHHREDDYDTLSQDKIVSAKLYIYILPYSGVWNLESYTFKPLTVVHIV
jgi:hypothetical protein